jgi:amino acid transporter
MQAITTAFHSYNIEWLIPVMTLLILIGSLGGIINWVISPAKGLLQAGQAGFLPSFLIQENKHGIAANLLITQACIVSIVCFIFLEMPSVGGTYWILTALNTQLYMLMYIMLFITGIYSRFKFTAKEKSFRIPGGKLGIYLITIAGLVGCLVTLLIGFFPPDKINVGDHTHYFYLLLSGLSGAILPINIFYFYRNATLNKQAAIAFVE